ncbi:unnamed protein product [Effrenium voratum]|uniref:Uncharacterized protein n=1 Tax=Effrenium voratum TaxID=2562239 RepID=A0AA36NF63_9DINO|nr:unnamed protein product [Effrenium voratum]CAJ1454053.1 unnamed protein product [Effrenium voratum]
MAFGLLCQMLANARISRPQSIQHYKLSSVVYDKQGCDWKHVATWLAGIPVIGLGCVVAITAAYGFVAVVVILWAPAAVLLCLLLRVLRQRPARGHGVGRKVHCQGICCFGVLLHVAMADPAALLRYEPEVPASAAKESLDVAVLNTHQHTIVFEGNVLPGLHSHVLAWEIRVRLGHRGGGRSARGTQRRCGVPPERFAPLRAS